MFPRYSDWDIAYTRNTTGKFQKVKQIPLYIAIVVLVIGALLVRRERQAFA